MAVFKSLTFDGENSLDYGVYITGEAVYNAPGRVVDMVTIPGRNGSLAIDQGRFENIEITYPAGAFGTTQTEYSKVMRAFRNFLASRYRYVRLEDDYHPDEYRLGLFKSGLEVDPVSMSRAGEFDIVFDCKPQRFLKSGEVPVSGADWTNVQTASGSVVTINNSGDPLGIKSLTASIEPVQSGSGTPSPSNVRPISGHTSVVTNKTGKNLLPVGNGTFTASGVTALVEESGVITLNGTATANNGVVVSLGRSNLNAPDGIYYGKLFGDNLTGLSFQIYENNVAIFTKAKGSFTLSGSHENYVRVRWASGTTFDNVKVYPMMTLGTEEPTAYEPYKGETYTAELGRTVYGGTLDVTTGLLTVTKAAIDMGTLSWTYNATSQIHTAVMPSDAIAVINVGDVGAICSAYERGDYPNDFADGKFVVCDSNLSSSAQRIGVKNTAITDATAFKTAVTGQTLVYTLATPQTYQLTPQEIDLLLGDNNIWASTGGVTVEYGQSPFYNPTEFPSKPLIKVTGTGTLMVGGVTITITGVAGQTIYIDCESMEIYKMVDGEVQSAASLVTFSGNDFPVLSAGNTGVSYGSGITALEITPHWWRI